MIHPLLPEALLPYDRSVHTAPTYSLSGCQDARQSFLPGYANGNIRDPMHSSFLQVLHVLQKILYAIRYRHLFLLLLLRSELLI